MRNPGKARLPEGATFSLYFVTPVRDNVDPSSLRRLQMRLLYISVAVLAQAIVVEAFSVAIAQ